MRRFILVIGTCVTAVAAAPTAASACPSPGHVKAYHGHAYVYFDQTATGPDLSSGGTETVKLDRTLHALHVNLNHKAVLRHAVIFSGKVSGGNVEIADAFNNTGTAQSGKDFYSGPLKTAFPDRGGAELIFHAKSCQYQLVLTFGVESIQTGNADDSGGLVMSGSATSHKEHVPTSLKLSGGGSIAAYYSCPGNPLETGKACYDFSGGWASDFDELQQCGSVASGNCDPSDQQVGSALFGWTLSPKLFKGK